MNCASTSPVFSTPPTYPALQAIKYEGKKIGSLTNDHACTKSKDTDRHPQRIKEETVPKSNECSFKSCIPEKHQNSVKENDIRNQTTSQIGNTASAS